MSGDDYSNNHNNDEDDKDNHLSSSVLTSVYFSKLAATEGDYRSHDRHVTESPSHGYGSCVIVHGTKSTHTISNGHIFITHVSNTPHIW